MKKPKVFLMVLAVAIGGLMAHFLVKTTNANAGVGKENNPSKAFDCATVVDVPQSECLALVKLFESTNGAAWTRRDNWLVSNTVGDWFGVTVTLGRVEKLALYINQLKGTLPAELKDLTGLRTLDLSLNKISGPIPDSYGSFEKLNLLDISFNQLSGKIPPSLGQLPMLERLSLANNLLSESIPSSLGGLSRLWLLNLSGNQLSGNIPSELGNLSQLVLLSLSENRLTGEIPASLGQLSKLMSLSLKSNQISGRIPSEIGQLTDLLQFDVSHNELDGYVPASFTNLTKLCVEGDRSAPCNSMYKTDLGYNFLHIPQPNPPSAFLYEKDPDWDQTQKKRFKLYLPLLSR